MGGRRRTPMISPRAAWAIGRLLCGESLNGELQAISGPFRRLASHLADLPPEARSVAWQGFICSQPDADALVKAVAEIDPTGPPPEPETGERCATLADLRRIVADTQWPW